MGFSMPSPRHMRHKRPPPVAPMKRHGFSWRGRPVTEAQRKGTDHRQRDHDAADGVILDRCKGDSAGGSRRSGIRRSRRNGAAIKNDRSRTAIVSQAWQCGTIRGVPPNLNNARVRNGIDIHSFPSANTISSYPASSNPSRITRSSGEEVRPSEAARVNSSREAGHLELCRSRSRPSSGNRDKAS